MTAHRLIRIAFACVCVAGMTMAAACDDAPPSPVGPTPPAASAPTAPAPAPAQPVAATFHVSGTVTNEEGQPIPDNLVVLNHFEHFDDRGQPMSLATITKVRTDGAGRYAVDIAAIPDLFRRPWLPQIIGDGYAKADTAEYSNDFQFVTSTGSTVVRNFRLNRILNPGVGDSASVTFLPDDGVCTWDDSYTTLCRYMRVTVPGEGILTVSAVPLSADTTPISFVVLETDDRLPWHGGAGTMNYPVKTGVEFLIALNMRAGFSQARPYTLTTSFHADHK